MRVRLCGLLTVLCMLVLSGCNAVPSSMSGTRFGSMSEEEPADPSFQPGLGILNGFDEPIQAADWQPDDWLLLGVKVTHAGQDEVWFVRLSTLCSHPEADGAVPITHREFSVPFGIGCVKSGMKFTAPVCKVLIETYDNTGSFMRSSVRMVPQFSPIVSLLEVWQALHAEPDNAADERLNATKVNTAGLMVMLQTLASARALRPLRDTIRQEVIKPPTILGLIFNGLRVNLEANMCDYELQRSRWSADAALTPRRLSRFPVSLAGQHMFDCRMVVGSPNPPYQLLAGVLLFEAVHPEKPHHRLTIRVLSAKRIGAERLAKK